MDEWPLQDAKNKFSELVNAALAGEPQRVTRRGRRAVVVLAADEYERLCRLEEAPIPTFGELLLQIPLDDQAFERLDIVPRSLDLLCISWTRRLCLHPAASNVTLRSGSGWRANELRTYS